MKLRYLLEEVDYALIRGSLNTEVRNIAFHSDTVTEDTMFFAIRGHKCDGGKFIKEAIEKGATVIVLQDESDIPNYEVVDNIAVIQVQNVRKSLAKISSVFYGRPSEKMLVIGVTGTKGKTSVTYMIRQILEEAGIKTGLIGTVQSGFDNRMCDSDATTPQSSDIQKMLLDMFLNDCKAVVMEVSSQGLMQDRVEAIDFDIGVFTNISPDHIGEGEHATFEEYMFWKSKLFKLCSKAVVNIDDESWQDILKDSIAEKILYFGCSKDADFMAEKIKLCHKGQMLGSEYRLYSKKPCGDDNRREVVLGIPGEFNVYNSLAAIATTRALGIPWHIIFDALRNVKVPGRVETIDINRDFTVMIDYAHNGIALTSLLKSLKKYKPNRIILVFGCGGNRDRNRRFEMGKAAMELADYIIVTSDNPRQENPNDIIDDIISVMDFTQKNVLTIADRRRAIERAVEEAESGDIVVISGKGHEKYQIIGDKIIHFDDKEVVLTIGKGLR